MDTLFESVRNSEKAAGVAQIFTPGEIEDLKYRSQLDQGIPFTNGEIEALHVLANELGSDARLT